MLLGSSLMNEFNKIFGTFYACMLGVTLPCRDNLYHPLVIRGVVWDSGAGGPGEPGEDSREDRDAKPEGGLARKAARPCISLLRAPLP